MSYVLVGKETYLIDIFVMAAESPTGKLIRFRRRFKKPLEDIKRLDLEITLALRKDGAWSDPQLPQPSQSNAVRTKHVTGRSLRDALKMAWEDPEEGWCRAKPRSAAILQSAARRMVDVLGADRACASITRDDFATLRRHLDEQMPDRSIASVRFNITAFYRVLYFAEKAGWINSRPKIARSKEGVKSRMFVFSPTQEAAAVEFFNSKGLDSLADIFVLGIECGFRINEMLTLEASRVNMDSGLVMIPDELSKSGRFRQVVITPRATTILANRLKEHPRGILFPGLTHRTVANWVVKMRANLDISDPECVFHSTRHTCGSRMAAKNVPLPVMMDQLGHHSPAQTMRYIHMTAVTRRKVLLEAMADV